MNSLQSGVLEVLECEKHQDGVINILLHLDNRESIEEPIYLKDFYFLLR